MHLIFILLYNSSELVGSEFGGTWEDSGSGFIKIADKRALKQDQTLHMEEKLQFILYFSTECDMIMSSDILLKLIQNFKIYSVE